LAPENGTLIRLAPGPAEIIARVPAGRLALDGKALVSADSEAIRHRHRMSFNGVIMASVVIEPSGRLLTPPRVSLDGLLEGEEADAAIAKISNAIDSAIDALPPSKRGDDAEVGEAARLAARRWYHKAFDRKPVTKIHVIRV
jgi:ribonuclease J